MKLRSLSNMGYESSLIWRFGWRLERLGIITFQQRHGIFLGVYGEDIGVVVE